MKKIRLGLLCPILDDATSFYRGLGPYDTLCKEQDWQISFPQQLSWAALSNIDVLVLQRPAMPEHFATLVLAKNMGIPVIVDFDDDNLSVPRDNPTHAQYSQMPVKEAILNLARHSDALVVSTNFMKEKYGIYNKRTVLIPNALPDSLVKRRMILSGKRENKFVWRGNPSQTRNLYTVAMSLLNLAKNHPDQKFVFFGYEPFELTEQLPNREVIPALPLMDYFQQLIRCHANCLYYPLHNQDHSQARSHISWLEGTYANMAVLAYGNDEFKRPGCLNYLSLTEFEDTMSAIATGQIDIDMHVEESWAEIQDKYLLSKTNAKRLEIIESLLCST